MRALQPLGALHVTVDDIEEVSVRKTVGAATFTSSDSKLQIDNRGSFASVVMVIPRSAPRVEILVAGRRVLLATRARIVAPQASLASGVYTISLVHSKTSSPD